MKIRTFFFHLILAFYSFFYVIPLIWMFYSSFKDNGKIFDNPFSLPESWDLGVFIEAWNAGGLGKYILNSALITTLATATVLLVSSMAAFAFSRYEFPLKRYSLTIFVLGLLLPIQAYFIAQNELFEFFGLKDSRFTLVLPYAGLGIPLATWLLKAYLDSLPKELFEAARVDGSSDFGMYRSIAVPLLKPGIATVAIFTALGSWNEFLLANIYVQNDDYKTIPAGLLAFSTKYVTDYQLLFAALTVVTIPMIIVYIAFNKQVVARLTEGSLK
ncbi:MAG: carbohydrate ABC transporter permease [Actinomycetota bacterium]